MLAPKSKLLITGVNGFVGKNLQEYFQAKNYSLFTPSSKELDLTATNQVEAYFKQHQIDHIIHCAKVGGARTETDLKDVLRVNLRMFFNLVRLESQFQKLIYFGSGAAFDQTKPIINVKENEVLDHVPQDEYGLSKNVMARYTANRRDQNIVCLRLFGIYGKYEDYTHRFISSSIVKNLLGQPIKIHQNAVVDYLDVADLSWVVDYVLKTNLKHRTYNVTSGNKTELKQLAEIINQVAEQPSPIIIKKPGFKPEYTGNNSRLLKELPPDFKFTPHRVAIKKLYQWYRNNLNRLELK